MVDAGACRGGKGGVLVLFVQVRAKAEPCVLLLSVSDVIVVVTKPARCRIVRVAPIVTVSCKVAVAAVGPEPVHTRRGRRASTAATSTRDCPRRSVMCGLAAGDLRACRELENRARAHVQDRAKNSVSDETTLYIRKRVLVTHASEKLASGHLMRGQ
jgi:hypothetical protein